MEMYNLLGDPAVALVRPRDELKIVRTDDRWNPKVVVRVPTPEFGGFVDVDWVDAGGKVVDSQRFEARDRLFYLPMPDRAQQVIVAATDTRSGAVAIGSYHLPEPPKPKAVVATPVPVKQAVPVASPPPAPSTPPKAADAGPKRNLPDRIARRSFDLPPTSVRSAESSLAAGQH
ncbi:MAG TPA: hypothetical protein VF132_06380 [Rudaea sp.]